jgi:muconate cycloisomerase
MKAKGIVLMACETASTFGAVKEIVQNGHYQMVNVKLSRNGGFRRSLSILQYLRDNSVAFQIGCSIGESGVLSAAGRVLGLLCGDAKYYDGSYDAYLLKENLTDDSVTFGYKGEAGPLPGPGLGVVISRGRLARLSGGKPVLSVSRP